MIANNSVSPQRYQFIVSFDTAQITLKEFLLRHAGLSRKQVRSAHLANEIQVNGQSRYLNYKVVTEDIITVCLQNDKASNILPEAMSLDIIYEDEDILVIDKPPGLVVHPTLGYGNNTLANGIAFHWQQRGIHAPVRLVNRLDRNTSGLVLVAANEYVHHYLSQQFQQGEAEKRYLALVEGKMMKEKGTIDKPIGLCEDSIIKRCITDSGKKAITHFNRVTNFDTMTLVEVLLETGRTHQIRVHFAAIGHPLVGDSLYGNTIQPQINRQALHAASLKLRHPRTQESCLFTSDVPKDIQQLIDSLRIDIN